MPAQVSPWPEQENCAMTSLQTVTLRSGLHRSKANVAPEMHEGRHLIDLLCTLYNSVRRRSPDAGALVRCAVQVQDRIGLPDSALPATMRLDGETPLTVIEWERLGRSLALRRARSASSTSFLDTWLSRLSHMVALDELEAAILGLALAYGQDSAVERLWDELSSNRGRPSLLRADPELFGLLLGVQTTAVRCCLEAEGRLRTSGLLVLDDDGDMTVLARLCRLLARRTPLQGDVRALLLSPPRDAELNWEAFRHLGEQAKAAARLLAAAIEQREPGINILLYGPPGAGKTAFAATLADRVGASLYPVGEADSDGGEPSRGERLAELRLNQRLLAESASVLLFDEAEDLFTSVPFFRQVPTQPSVPAPYAGARPGSRDLDRKRLKRAWAGNSTAHGLVHRDPSAERRDTCGALA